MCYTLFYQSKKPNRTHDTRHNHPQGSSSSLTPYQWSSNAQLGVSEPLQWILWMDLFECPCMVGYCCCALTDSYYCWFRWKDAWAVKNLTNNCDWVLTNPKLSVYFRDNLNTQESDRMPRPRKNIVLNFDAISTALNSGDTIKLKVLAAEYGTCPPVIKRCLIEFYGDKIDFVPGRNGGVRNLNTTQSQTNCSPSLAAVA